MMAVKSFRVVEQSVSYEPGQTQGNLLQNMQKFT